MTTDKSRRRLLGSAAALAGVSALGAWPSWVAPRVAAAFVPFGFDALISHLLTRSDIRRLGIAPLTSMFWYSETDARRGKDFGATAYD